MFLTYPPLPSFTVGRLNWSSPIVLGGWTHKLPYLTSWSDHPVLQAEALAQLEEMRIQHWEITWPGLDLTLHFENALALRLFCDQTDEMD
jgi:hypothetical protein